ncbi:DUF2796 domain-containing protein [Variovorax sp. LT1P1]|uniref:DUF2796 domain-containing protein n=1 Tax=Variovorax sp. LT1P1 TaxID=3443730 RepID=UPI003F4512EE
MMCGRFFRLLASAALVAAPFALQAQSQHAHVHGQIELDVVVDGPTVVITMEAPLDNFVGFERAPRNADEKKAVDDAVARLRAADTLFAIDPAGNCKLGPVELRAPVLGLGTAPAGAAAAGHADLDATFAFNCASAAATKFIDVGLFTAFKGPRQIDVQIAAPQGQFKRTLKRPNARIAWGK